MVQTRIDKSIEENIENDFEFTFDDFNINWFSQNIELKGFNLSLFDDIDTVSFFTGDLTIHIRGWRNIIFDDTKIIETIVLKEAEIYYSFDHPVKIKNKNEKKDQKLEISNVRAFGKLMITEKHEQQSGELSSYFNLTVPLNYESELGISIDKVINKINHCEVSEIHYFLSDGFYQLKVKKLIFTDFKDIMLNQIVVTPIDSRKIFAKKKKLATDYVSVAVDSINLIDFNSNINKKIYLDQISLFQPSIVVYKDKNYPEDPEFKTILVDLLQELKTPVFARQIEVNNMFIKYSQLANQASVAGDLFFSNAHATILNITNVKDSLQLSRNMHIEAEAEFYGEGKLKTSMIYDMLSNSGQFGVEGSLGSMDIVKVNKIISKLVPVKVESGQLKSLRFNFSGSRDHSDGEMWFKYSDLKIQMLEVEYLNSNFTQNLMSSIGNMVLRNSNPSDKGIFKIGDIDKDRITNKSMFNYWWVSLQSGFLSTLGVTAEKQKVKYQSRKK